MFAIYEICYYVMFMKACMRVTSWSCIGPPLRACKGDLLRASVHQSVMHSIKCHSQHKVPSITQSTTSKWKFLKVTSEVLRSCYLLTSTDSLWWSHLICIAFSLGFVDIMSIRYYLFNNHKFFFNLISPYQNFYYFFK